MLVTYTQKNGFKQVREVPANLTDEKDYSRGILVGPPDLSDLRLPLEKERALNNLLVERNLATFAAAQRNRNQLMDVIKEIYGLKDKDKMIELLIIYQNYFNGG